MHEFQTQIHMSKKPQFRCLHVSFLFFLSSVSSFFFNSFFSSILPPKGGTILKFSDFYRCLCSAHHSIGLRFCIFPLVCTGYPTCILTVLSLVTHSQQMPITYCARVFTKESSFRISRGLKTKSWILLQLEALDFLPFIEDQLKHAFQEQDFLLYIVFLGMLYQS